MLPTGFQRCGSQWVRQQLHQAYPQLTAAADGERRRTLEQYRQILRGEPGRINSSYTIPVVVHILLPDPSLITDAQVQSQLETLNTDFGGLNADSTRLPAAFKPLYGKSNIRFCLARTDPRGDATNGILRKASTVTSVPGLNDPVKADCNGGSDAWDPARYLNIWVCQVPQQFLGYSFFASDLLSVVPLRERGLVMGFRAFGRGGTAQAPFNLGRTGTHETGHFFDLFHTWGPNNCGGAQSCADDDEIADTPLQLRCTYGAPPADSVITDACSPAAPGIMWMNFMDYVDDRAMVFYTPQQYARMEATILANAWVLQLATSTACNPPPARNRDLRFEGFRDPGFEVCGRASDTVQACSNSYRPLVSYRNVGSDTIRSLVFTARLGNGSNVVTNWTGLLPPQSTATFTLNPLPLSTGINNNLLVYSALPNSLADEQPANDTGRLAAVVYPLGTLPLTEGFESTPFPPVNWLRYNPDGDTTWRRTTRAARQGNASLFINNYDYNANGLSDWMITPLLPVAGKDSVFLRFQVAAATFSLPDAPFNPTDTLEILYTADCGAGWNRVYKKWGSQLVTTGNVAVDSAFVPGTAQWRSDSVYLGDFSASASGFIRVAFRNITNYENNLYIDDVQIYFREVNPNLRRKGVMATPNPFRNTVMVQHYPSPINLEYMEVYNSMGQRVWQRRFALGSTEPVLGPNSLEIDLAGQPAGIYFLSITYRSAPRKIIKLVKTL